jgi:hypothetical protein|tara:strand:- start:516 stop:1175 length:660 start_codon:yes stop_codon:yes gene_type:complete
MSDEKEAEQLVLNHLAELKGLRHHLKINIEQSNEIVDGEGGMTETKQRYALLASSLSAVVEFVEKASPPNTEPRVGTLLNELRKELLDLANGVSDTKLLKAVESGHHHHVPSFLELYRKVQILYAVELMTQKDSGMSERKAREYVCQQLFDTPLEGIKSPIKPDTVKDWEERIFKEQKVKEVVEMATTHRERFKKVVNQECEGKGSRERADFLLNWIKE